MLGAMNLSLGVWKNLALGMKKQDWGDAKKLGKNGKGRVPPSSFSLLFHPRLQWWSLDYSQLAKQKCGLQSPRIAKQSIENWVWCRERIT